MTKDKRFIEESFPVKEVSKENAYEKYWEGKILLFLSQAGNLAGRGRLRKKIFKN